MASLTLTFPRILLVAFAALASLMLTGCDEQTNANVQSVKIGGKWFHLELALDDTVRVKGLGQRDHIEEDGGMLFVFPGARESAFVMRDCPVPIDVIYLDGSSRIVAMHQMQPDPPRGPDEGKPGEIVEKYEKRLKQYPSRFPTQFVIELKGGTLPGLKLKEGERIDLPIADLKKRAK